MEVAKECQFKYSTKSTTSFTYLYNPDSSKPKEVILDKINQKPKLYFNYRECMDDDVYTIQFTLRFDESIPDENQRFNISASFGKSDHAYTSKLHRIHSKKFESKKHFIFEPQICFDCSFNIHIEISYDIIINNKDDFMTKSMKDILINETYSDLKLVVDGKIYNVHKSILASRNQVFAGMIGDMVSKDADSISLPGWEITVVQELLLYIYTGKCDFRKTPLELFELSHFLMMDELQQSCKDYLIANVQKKNLIGILQLIEQPQYNLGDLKKAADKFIEKNESSLAKYSDFIEYLSESISLKNVKFILYFSNRYGLKNLLKSAMKFVCSNYNEVKENPECNKFLKANPDLLLDTLQFSIEK